MPYKCIPDWRWLAVQKAKTDNTPPEDEFLLTVYNVIVGKNRDEEIERAIDLYQLPYKRDTLTSFFLSRATLAQIRQGTNIPETVLEIYEQLFMDSHQFLDKMDRRIYARTYRDTICEAESRPIIDKAIVDGPYALLQYWAEGSEMVNIPDAELASKLAMMAWTKVTAASQESILSDASKEALKWVKAANQLVNSRNRLHPDPADTDEVLVGIKDREVTIPVGMEGLGIPEDELVH